MAGVRLAHTADLDAATLLAARTLLYDVFDKMTEHNWEHTLGGMHALVWEGTELVGHASVIQRRLLHGGRALRTGHVEGVAVRADRRGRGHGAAMMAALETVVRGAYELGVPWRHRRGRGTLCGSRLDLVAGTDFGAYPGRYQAHQGR
jgi:aminoglycoside 2'-N-acetyltransferase I